LFVLGVLVAQSSSSSDPPTDRVIGEDHASDVCTPLLYVTYSVVGDAGVSHRVVTGTMDSVCGIERGAGVGGCDGSALSEVRCPPLATEVGRLVLLDGDPGPVELGLLSPNKVEMRESMSLRSRLGVGDAS